MSPAEVVAEGIELVLKLIEKELEHDDERTYAKNEIANGIRESQRFILRAHSQQQLDARKRGG